MGSRVRSSYRHTLLRIYLCYSHFYGTLTLTFEFRITQFSCSRVALKTTRYSRQGGLIAMTMMNSGNFDSFSVQGKVFNVTARQAIGSLSIIVCGGLVGRAAGQKPT